MNNSAVLHDVLRDLTYGVRVLRRNPGFAAVATLSLAIGIGLNTTMFSIVNAVLLRDTRVTDPSSLVEVYSSASKEFPQMTTSYPDFLDLRANVKALTGLAAHSMARGILTHAGRSELSMGEVVTENYFDLLGVPLAQGGELFSCCSFCAKSARPRGA